MAGLPTSLSIAFWLAGSMWLVAMIGRALDAPREIIWITLAAGLIAAIAEWIACERRGR